MKHLLTALVLMAVSHSSHAKCTAHDLWTGDDKNMHFAAGVGIASLVTLYTSDPWDGFYVGTAVGVAKEVYDASGSGECSLQDLVVQAAGSALGAYLGNIYITRTQGKTAVTYAAPF